MFLLDMEGGQDGGLFYEQGKKIKDVNFSGKIIANETNGRQFLLREQIVYLIVQRFLLFTILMTKKRKNNSCFRSGLRCSMVKMV